MDTPYTEGEAAFTHLTGTQIRCCYARRPAGKTQGLAWSLHGLGHAHRLDGSTLSLRLTAYDWPSSRKTPFDLARYSVPGYMAPLRDLPPEGMPGSTCGFKGGSYLLSIASTKSW